MAKDLSAFINQLRELHPDELIDIKRTVEPQNYDVTAILEHLTRADRFPLVQFNSTVNLRGEVSEFSIVSNVFASRERCADALGFPRDECKMPLSLEYARRELQSVQALSVPKGDAPVKQIIATGDQVDLRKLPIVRHFEMDIGPFLTMACVMRDPDEGFYDVTFVKTLYRGPRKLGTAIHSPHFDRILDKYERRGQPAPIINVLGHHPAFFLGCLSLAPWGSNDYDSIGAFLGEPLRLTGSETWGDDFLVPADAEIVVEGEIAPGVREILNPFGEVTRHYQAQCLRPVTNVTALTYRQNAKLEDIFSGHRGHWNLGGLPKEGSIYNAIDRKFGGIKAVHMPHSGCGRFACYISIQKKREGQAKIIAMEALTHTPLLQWVVVVDEDIDVFNESDVVWAILTCTNPKRDVNFVENAFNFFTTAMGHGKMIIDATRPLDIAFPAGIKVPDDAMARIKLEEWL
ncbi:MAG: UbiD family decarboxylase [Chloroflexi bacterium]|nr:UbiD family decarboxylase [Chloroflexota bacterium]